MKLFVIVLCLLSERFFVHVKSHHRFDWFLTYEKKMVKYLSKIPALATPGVMLSVTLLPILILAAFILSVFSYWVFGFVGLLFNLIIFYYCVGPTNPFYPASAPQDDSHDASDVGEYLAGANGQLFAVIFWYILLGPLAVLSYRLISLCQNRTTIGKPAKKLTQILDWLPARMTVLLYLLVGNFQAGLKQFSRLFFTAPAKNQTLLSTCGLKSLGSSNKESVTITQAENLVEHALITLLVLLACLTLVAWM